MTYVLLVYLQQVFSNYLYNVMITVKKHSITFNVSKSVCMFFKSEDNKRCDNTDMFLSGKAIDFVQETKHLDTKFENSMHKPMCYYETLSIVLMTSVYVV